MTENRVLFSLVVLTYNRPNLLTSCLESIVQQDFSGPFEVVVIDDGSSTNNEQVTDRFKSSFSLNFHYQNHQGIVPARNQGIKHAKGQYIAFIADDYTLPKDYLKKAKIFFETTPDAKVLTFNIYSSGSGLGCMVQQLYTELALWQNIKDVKKDVVCSQHLPASRAAIFHRSVFESIGPFNEALKGGEDSEFSLRLSQQGFGIHFMPQVYIQHLEQKSFWGFLKQRYAYGSSTLALHREKGLNYRRLSLLTLTWRTYLSLFRTSTRIQKRTEFLLLTPWLVMFIFSFWLGYHRSQFTKCSDN